LHFSDISRERRDSGFVVDAKRQLRNDVKKLLTVLGRFSLSLGELRLYRLYTNELDVQKIKVKGLGESEHLEAFSNLISEFVVDFHITDLRN